MDGEHQYEITLKKDGLFINLSSDDVYFISKQMDKWFRILLDDSYVPVTLPQRPEPAPVAQAPAQPVAQPMPEAPPVAQAPPVQPQPQPSPPMEVPPAAVAMAAPQPEVPPVVVQQVAQPAVAPSQYAEVNLPLTQQPAAPAVAQAAPQPQPVAPVQPLPPAEPIPEALPELVAQPVTVAQQQPVAQPAPVQAPLPQPQPVAVAAPAMPQPQANPNGQDDFEAVMDSLMKDLDDDGNGGELPYTAPSGAVGPEPDLTLVTSLADLCDRSNAANSEDYLLLSAYYLTRIERQATFSLKKVNSALVKSGLTPVNHSILETVLSRGFLSMVPDLNGTAEVTEYMMTVEGQQAATILL